MDFSEVCTAIGVGIVAIIAGIFIAILTFRWPITLIVMALIIAKAM